MNDYSEPLDTLEPPYVTPDLPGVGGVLKQTPSDFVVEELPLYEPCGEGEHIYLRLRREGWTTRAIQQRLARLFVVAEDAVGYAGLKDKQARVTQTFSVQLAGLEPAEAARQAAAELGALSPPMEVLGAQRHGNKLKSGHLLGNRFGILAAGTAHGALESAQAVAQAIEQRGLPNYFGPQRFGRQGDNARQGRQAIQGRGPREKWLRKLLLSAWQSEQFNLWLGRRLTEGRLGLLMAGDVAKKTDTGGLFTVEDPALEQPRLDERRITYTGPLLGGKMLWAQGPAGQIERALLEEQGLAEPDLKKAGLSGSRRVARIFPAGLVIQNTDQGLLFEFALPKGSYATVLLREFMKQPLILPED